MNSEDVTFILILPLAVIIAGVVIIVAGLRHRARMLELVHKERVAMIERGIVPPELGPGGDDTWRTAHAAGRRSRSFSLGIIVMGLGFALMTLIGIAAQAPSEAIGIGGAIAILGAAFIVRSLLTAPQGESMPTPPRRPAPAPSALVPPPDLLSSESRSPEPLDR